MEARGTSEVESVGTWARLHRVAQSLLAEVESELKASGLPPLVWYDALLELRRAGARGLRPYELQREMLLAQYNLSRLIDRLAKEGLVTRLPCPEDGRGQRLRITAAGRALLRRAWPVYRAAIDSNFTEKLSADDRKRLKAILGKLKSGAQ